MNIDYNAIAIVALTTYIVMAAGVKYGLRMAKHDTNRAVTSIYNWFLAENYEKTKEKFIEVLGLEEAAKYEKEREELLKQYGLRPR